MNIIADEYLKPVFAKSFVFLCNIRAVLWYFEPILEKLLTYNLDFENLRRFSQTKCIRRTYF